MPDDDDDAFEGIEIELDIDGEAGADGRNRVVEPGLRENLPRKHHQRHGKPEPQKPAHPAPASDPGVQHGLGDPHNHHPN